MAEVGCLKDECLQNLQVEGLTDLNQVTYREKIEVLADQNADDVAIRSPLTMQDSGKHFIVPALTGGTQLLVLPDNSVDNVGFTCKFTMSGTAAQIFSVDQPNAEDEKIYLAAPVGDGDFVVNTFDKIRFTADALIGASFRITCISATDATAFLVSNVISGLAAGTGDVVGANV